MRHHQCAAEVNRRLISRPILCALDAKTVAILFFSGERYMQQSRDLRRTAKKVAMGRKKDGEPESGNSETTDSASLDRSSRDSSSTRDGSIRDADKVSGGLRT